MSSTSRTEAEYERSIGGIEGWGVGLDLPLRDALLKLSQSQIAFRQAVLLASLAHLTLLDVIQNSVFFPGGNLSIMYGLCTWKGR